MDEIEFNEKFDLTYQDTLTDGEKNEYQRASQKCYQFLLSIKNRKFEMSLLTIVTRILDYQVSNEKYSETLQRLINIKKIY